MLDVDVTIYFFKKKKETTDSMRGIYNSDEISKKNSQPPCVLLTTS